MPYSKELVPSYIKELKVYQAGKPIEELAREKNLTRISKIASNENPLGPSPFAIKSMTEKLWEIHRYPDMHAYALKNRLCELYKLKMGNIILGNGSEGIMAYIVRAFLGPGQEVITSENSFIGFTILSRAVGAAIKAVPLTKDYRFDVQKIAEAITPKTKVIYIANPNNPTGTYIRKEEFDYLMSHVPEHVLVMLDEAYFEFADASNSDYPDSMDYRYDNVITLRTFSKAYGLAGIRCGYGFANDELITHLSKVKLPFEPGSLAQIAAVGALEDRPHLERTLSNNKIEMERLIKFLTKKKFPFIPSVTNFIAIKTGSAQASEELFESLMNVGVIIRPLRTNEMPEFVRVSIGTPQEMDHFYEAMESLLPAYDNKHGRVNL